MPEREIDKDHGREALFDRRVFTGGLITAAATCALNLTFNSLSSTKAYAEPTSAEKQAEADEVKKRLDAWAVELNLASARYYLALEAHEISIQAMNEAMGRIRAAEAEVSRLQDRLNARATAMYKQGQYSFLEVIFGARSFNEFTTTWDVLNSMNDGDVALVEQSKTAKKVAQSAHDDYATQERIAQEKLNEANEIRAQAEQIVADFMAELASLDAEIAMLIQKEREEEERREREAREAEAKKYTGGYWGDGIPKLTAGKAHIICEAAISRLGCPYIWAHSGPDSFDCSGLTQWCYKQAGVSIPRVDSSQRTSATSVVPVMDAIPGDILWEPGHVGIYMGDGAFIDAPFPGEVVRYGYNMNKWYCACRY